MASIKQALKSKTSYTNKNGVTIPYRDLSKMKQLNDMLNYYGKVLGIKTTHERINIGALAGDYSARLSKLKVATQVMEYARLRQKRPKLKTKKAISKWQRSVNWYKGKLGKAFDGATLNITEEAVKMFRESGEKLKITNIYNFNQNLKKSIESNFEALIGKELADKLKDFVDSMDIYELHRLAKDNPDLLSYLYYDPSNISSRLETIVERLEEVTGRKVFTSEELEEAVDNIMDFGIADTTSRFDIPF